MEGLTAQTVESGGGLLFTSKQQLREEVVRLATDECLRLELGNKLKHYLEHAVSWEIVARQYFTAYELAIRKVRRGRPVYIRPEF
jgi:hypothetical protein